MSQHHEHPKLNQAFATAICGNDILSSSLYVSGIAVLYAGVLAPVVLLVIGIVLFFYKAVYTEVVEALPINGGAYNCLLNGTSKTIAAIAGVMTFLSYIATAVISAKVGQEYLHTILPQLPVIPATIGLLFVFALLVINGIKDSAKVALGIFLFHIATLVGFLVLGALHYLSGHSYLAANLSHTFEIITKQGGYLPALYLAFSASLLGVSGFESSANFVEEQGPGVFRKTLRNMLLGVIIFNPLIALVVLNSMPHNEIIAAKDFLLSDAAKVIGGSLFQIVVVIDAFLVLAGAVLTAYVGVTGLLQRMTADACLPRFFYTMNKKGSFPRIVLTFFVLCSSILLITKGDLLSLAGVYTIAFLGVMSLFAFGNLILRETRTELKRTYKAPFIFVVLALLATVFGVFGNIRINPDNLRFFELYFIPVVIIVLGVIYQDYIFKFLLRATKGFKHLNTYINLHFNDVTEGKFIVFIHNIHRLHRILEYINRNETGWNITLVHCNDSEEEKDDTYKELKETVPVLQKAGVYPHFNIELMYVRKSFSPEVVDEISKKLRVRKNRVFIGSIHHEHPYTYDELGGARIIL